MSDRPKDAEFKIGPLWYKIGLHGLSYVWLDSGWIRSTKTPAELKAKNTLTKGEKNGVG